ncbi:DUF3325 domain-containing protein [Belnapia sp. T6]|uniref:DUF3325 domain-containing protein n=1 Tax=Belnapia mucosa TaxID=2804532 RepID=A0ABS1V9M4_9PROT|nr:DUF3325 domain-containing protein [Belnapia mucosa]MBL6458380.1 DUF3325 domain-containing protein [Belnapia mucosa]
MAPLAFGLAYAGFLALALAMDRHHRDLLGGVPSRMGRLLFRGGGWMLLGLSIAPCCALWGPSFGAIAWCGLLTLAAFTLVSLTTYAPRAALLAAALLPALGLATWFRLS